MGEKKRKREKATRKHLNKTQEVLYGHAFKMADRAADREEL